MVSGLTNRYIRGLQEQAVRAITSICEIQRDHSLFRCGIRHVRHLTA